MKKAWMAAFVSVGWLGAQTYVIQNATVMTVAKGTIKNGSIVVKDGTVTFTTKGDAVNAVQTWSVPANGHIGRVVAHLWHLGYLLWWVSRPWGRIMLVVIPVLLLGGYEIKRIWAPDRDEDDAEPA